MPNALREKRAESVTLPFLALHLDSIENIDYWRKAKSLVSKAYQRGMRSGLVTHNPANGLTVAAAKPKEIVPPSAEEVEKLLVEAESVNASLAVFLGLSAHIGCRRSEVIALQGADLDKDSVVIRRNLIEKDGQLIERATKTGHGAHRRLALSKEVREPLDTLPRTKGCKWLFSHDGATRFRPGYVSLAMKRLPGNFSLHSLRHFTATQMFGLGYSVVDVAHRLGDSPMTVLKTYAHFIPDKDRAIADSLPF